MQIGEDRSEGGYKGLATRLSNDLGRDISPGAVKGYLKRKEKTASVRDIKHRAKRARSEGAYKYGSSGAIYKMLKGHFGEGIEYNLEDIERAELEEAVKEVKSKHPGLKHVSAKTRSETVKKAKKGEKIGEGGFKAVEAKAAKRYGSEKSGKRVAAAAMWKMKKLRGK